MAAPPPQGTPEAPEKKASSAILDRNHHLGPGDSIEISVGNLKDLGRTIRLFSDGCFDYPFLGTVQAAGLTTRELAEKMTEGLKKILRRPVVAVELKEVYVPPKPEKEKVETPRITALGAVSKKGQMELPEPKPLRTVLAEIGPTEKADLSRIRVRYPDGSARTADFSQFNRTGMSADDLLIKGGEEIIILERPPDPTKGIDYVRIVGQVANPTQYELKPQMTLEDLILGAGKLTPLADVEHVQLHRRGQPVQTLDLLEQQRKGVAGLVRLQPGDEIFIPEQKDTVIVLGAVPNPGPQALEPGDTIREFFLKKGGSTGALNPASVNLKAVEVIREGQPVAKVDLRAILKNPAHRENLALKSGDLLFVPPQRQASGRPQGVLGYLSQLGPLSLLFGLF